jgi:non-homologous end joining protein Ku
VKESEQFEKEVLPVQVAPEEPAVAKTLAGQMAAEDFDVAAYSDKYKINRKLIESKVQGKEVEPPPEEAPATVINLMEALQKSVAAAKKAAGDRLGRLVAPASAATAKDQRKRNTS